MFYLLMSFICDFTFTKLINERYQGRTVQFLSTLIYSHLTQGILKSERFFIHGLFPNYFLSKNTIKSVLEEVNSINYPFKIGNE